MEIILGIATIVLGVVSVVQIITSSRERTVLSKMIKAKDVAEFEYMLQGEKKEEEEEEESDLVELEDMPDLKKE